MHSANYNSQLKTLNSGCRKRQLTKTTEEERSRLADGSVQSRLDSTMLHMPASRPRAARWGG